LNRNPTQPSAEFEALCDQRDELAVRLSLLLDNPSGNRDDVEGLRLKIFDLDRKIKVVWKGQLP
jgi:hypothetical protein